MQLAIARAVVQNGVSSTFNGRSMFTFAHVVLFQEKGGTGFSCGSDTNGRHDHHHPKFVFR